MGGRAFNIRCDVTEYDPLATPLADMARRLAAQEGSDQLRIRSWQAIYGFAKAHRIQPYEARILLLETGVRV
jgi:hypothetical protein